MPKDKRTHPGKKKKETASFEGFEGYCHNCMVGSAIVNVDPKDCRCSCHKPPPPEEESGQDWIKEFDGMYVDEKMIWDDYNAFVHPSLGKEIKTFISRLLKLKEQEVDSAYREIVIPEIKRSTKEEVAGAIAQWMVENWFVDDTKEKPIPVVDYYKLLDFLKTEDKLK